MTKFPLPVEGLFYLFLQLRVTCHKNCLSPIIFICAKHKLNTILTQFLFNFLCWIEIKNWGKKTTETNSNLIRICELFIVAICCLLQGGLKSHFCLYSNPAILWFPFLFILCSSLPENNFPVIFCIDEGNMRVGEKYVRPYDIRCYFFPWDDLSKLFLTDKILFKAW